MSELLTWIVDDDPKKDGQRREWPMAVYNGQFRKPAAYIISSTDQQYSSVLMKSGNHTPLRVIIMWYKDRDNPKGKRALWKGADFRTVREAMEFVEKFLETSPDWHPALV